MLSIKQDGKWYHRVTYLNWKQEEKEKLTHSLETNEEGFDWFFILWGDMLGQS